MAVGFPDKLKHNNDNLPIIDAKEVSGGFLGVDSVEDRNAIPIAKRGKLIDIKDVGLFRYVGADYEDVNWINDDNWQKPLEELIEFTQELMWNTGDSKIITFKFDPIILVNIFIEAKRLIRIRNDYEVLLPRQLRIDAPLVDGDIITIQFKYKNNATENI